MMFFLSLVVGASVGSFLCVFVERGNVRGRSRCTQCLRTLKWYELIPIVSWLALRAKCRTCQNKLSVRYLVWEIGTGLVFVATWWVVEQMGIQDSVNSGLGIGFWYVLVYRLILVSLWLLVVASDIKSKEVPIIPVAIGMVVALTISGFGIRDSEFGFHLLAGFFGGAFYFLQYWLSKGRWVGEGDIWLGVWMGLILGWPLILLGLAVAYIVGAIIASFLMMAKVAGMKSQLPMAPFLAVGTIAVWWFAPEFCRVLFYSICSVPL